MAAKATSPGRGAATRGERSRSHQLVPWSDGRRFMANSIAVREATSRSTGWSTGVAILDRSGPRPRIDIAGLFDFSARSDLPAEVLLRYSVVVSVRVADHPRREIRLEVARHASAGIACPCGGKCVSNAPKSHLWARKLHVGPIPRVCWRADQVERAAAIRCNPAAKCDPICTSSRVRARGARGGRRVAGS